MLDIELNDCEKESFGYLSEMKRDASFQLNKGLI